MARKAIQMVFVVLSAVGLIGIIICCALPEWLVRHHDDKVAHQGLWKTCVKHRTGLQECRTLDDSRLSNEICAFRNFTIISCILCGLSLLLLIFGADFTTCVQNQDTKTEMILAVSRGLILSGLLVIIPVSWETSEMRNAPKTMKLGVCIYIGFIAGLMLMLIGGVLCYLIRPGSRSSGGTAIFFRA